MERPWLAAKRYGYGAGWAITWEGRGPIMASFGIILLTNLFMMWAKSIPLMVLSFFVEMGRSSGCSEYVP